MITIQHMPEKQLIEFRELLLTAAEIIETNANSLLACSTIEGDWGKEFDAQHCYLHEIDVARQLRIALGSEVFCGECAVPSIRQEATRRQVAHIQTAERPARATAVMALLSFTLFFVSCVVAWVWFG